MYIFNKMRHRTNIVWLSILVWVSTFRESLHWKALPWMLVGWNIFAICYSNHNTFLDYVLRITPSLQTNGKLMNWKIQNKAPFLAALYPGYEIPGWNLPIWPKILSLTYPQAFARLKPPSWKNVTHGLTTLLGGSMAPACYSLLDQVSDYVRIPCKSIFWSDHRHSWSVGNDAPKWSTSIIYPLIFCSAGFIIPSQKVLKRNNARYFPIIACWV